MPLNEALAEYYPTIKELPEGERPRERLLHYGPGSLSTAELIAIILRVGGRDENVIMLSQRLITCFGGIAGLAQASLTDLMTIKGVGEAKAIEIKAAFELGKRLLVAAPHERPIVKSPADAANLLMIEMGPLEATPARKSSS